VPTFTFVTYNLVPLHPLLSLVKSVYSWWRSSAPKHVPCFR